MRPQSIDPTFEEARLVNLGDVCEILAGLTPRDLRVADHGGVPVVRASDLRNEISSWNALPRYQAPTLARPNAGRLRAGDILIPRVSKTLRAVLVSEDTEEYYAHHTLTVVRPKEGAPPVQTLLEHLRSPEIQELVASRASRLRDDLRISPSDLALLPIPVFSKANHSQADGVDILTRYTLAGSDLEDAIEQAQNLTPELLFHLKKHERDLESVPWDVLEHLIAELFASWGYADVRLVGRDRRTQADIMAVHCVEPVGTRLKYFVEVKRTRDRVGIEVINQVYGAFALEQPDLGWTLAIIVSLAGFKNTQRFTREQLEARNMHLRNREDVLNWLRNYRFGPTGLWLPTPKTEVV